MGAPTYKSMGMSDDTKTEDTTEDKPEVTNTHTYAKVIIGARVDGDAQEVLMPEGSKVMEAVFYEGRVQVWIKAPLDVEEETRTFRVISDGRPFDEAKVKHVGMALRPSGTALHVVEVIGS